MPHSADPYAHAIQTARVWLRHIADELGTDDQVFAYRVTRAWLHTVRDRLSVYSAAHLSTQLPELLRGTFFEGWQPAKVPVPLSVSSFIAEFATAAGVTEQEAYGLAWPMSDALRDLFAPGHLERACAALPLELHNLVFRVLTGPFNEEPALIGP